ncbi:gag protease polyprotein [Cucumis melo var. makuwa]|uniref:Gag protease polyprotein n=1 Tax=Cucumis melo var. makuwa TaxID=1194695 RepID=A0A5A7SLV4_CUCMM|nr:gag protease polyprotein [Cucumis melo var. makuwa]TYK14419.1 gag protease polyprotein [Cucumis melo var. makuwa]
MPPRKGARQRGGRGGRGAGRTQPEEQPAVQAANPTTFVTQADLVAMEKRYQDMLRDALTPFHAAQYAQAAPVQTQVAPAQTQTALAKTLVVPQVGSDQLSAEAKHLRDFRKYNPKTFDGSMDNPTKAQMLLTAIEKIFRYMKCPNDQKVQCPVFFLEDRGTAWWETAERMLGGDYDAEFDMLSRFGPDIVKDEEVRIEKFVRGLRLDLQGIVRALRPTTYADALFLALDLSLHERAHPSKAVDRGSTLGQKRKVELQPALAPQRNLRSGGVFQRHRQELAATGRTLRELPACRRCGRVHEGRCLVGSGVCFRHGLVVRQLCKHKLFPERGSFNPSSAASFKFKGTGTVVLPKVISALKASKLLNHCTWSIFASVVDTRELEVSLSSELVVREYPDFFIDELPRLLPLREIDFAID